MSRILVLLYGMLAYVIGMAGLVAFMLYMGGWSFLPLHIDSGEPGPLAPALAINLGLMLLFGLQHSITARPTFKKAVAKILPHAVERSTYVLLSGVILVLFCFYWQPIEGTLWRIETPILWWSLTALQILGWGMVVLSSFLINHFELFGLQRVYLYFRNKNEPSPVFTQRFLYSVVRHPLQLGLLIGMWSTATMSMTHLMLSGMMTIYILIGLHFEEKNLRETLGEPYENYQRKVRMLIPIPKR